jgi:sensitive to high expression protein 9
MQTILARYHEEQVWSDKIRSASTYGSLLALGLNMVVFILAIIIVEPWKRRRLTQTFEKKIQDMSIDNRAMVEDGMKSLEMHLIGQEKLLLDTLDTSLKPSNSRLLESADAIPAGMAQGISRMAKDREVIVVFAASTIAAAIIGWITRSWMGF